MNTYSSYFPNFFSLGTPSKSGSPPLLLHFIFPFSFKVILPTHFHMQFNPHKHLHLLSFFCSSALDQPQPVSTSSMPVCLLGQSFCSSPSPTFPSPNILTEDLLLCFSPFCIWIGAFLSPAACANCGSTESRWQRRCSPTGRTPAAQEQHLQGEPCTTKEIQLLKSGIVLSTKFLRRRVFQNFWSYIYTHRIGLFMTQRPSIY